MTVNEINGKLDAGCSSSLRLEGEEDELSWNFAGRRPIRSLDLLAQLQR